MGPQKFVDRILRVFQIGKLSRTGRTDFTTRRSQALADPVIAEGALVCRIGLRINEPAAVGTSLDTVAATEAVFLIDQHDPIRGNKGRSHGTDLGAGRICTMVAEFGNKEVLAAGLRGRRKPVLAAFWRIDYGIFHLPIRNVVAFDPRAVVA